MERTYYRTLHPAFNVLYPDVLTVQQTAELLSVCKNTIYKLIRENDLPCRRIGSAIRIRKNDALDYMRQ